jgi:hypothetical protein
MYGLRQWQRVSAAQTPLEDLNRRTFEHRQIVQPTLLNIAREDLRAACIVAHDADWASWDCR